MLRLFGRSVSIALLVVISTANAARAEQRELTLGLQPAYGLTYIDERSPSGGGGFAHLAYGITDAVGIQLTGGLTAHPLAAGTSSDMMPLLPGMLLTWNATAGIVYSLDIVRIVPFFEAGLGVLGTITRTDSGITRSIGISASLGLGADYLLTRRLALGVVIRYHAFLSDLGQIPIYLTVGPRFVVRFGL
jgi:hypothetical protein